jgi:hypothetical protein
MFVDSALLIATAVTRDAEIPVVVLSHASIR